MTRFQRLLVVLAVVNAATTCWFFSTQRQYEKASRDYLAYLNAHDGQSYDVTSTSFEATWVNLAAGYQSTAFRWMLIGFGVSVVTLLAYWIATGRHRS